MLSSPPPSRRRHRADLVHLLLLVAVACGGRTHGGSAESPEPTTPTARSLRPPAAFAGIADPAARSQALFLEASKVLTHARCVNCHPPDDTPRQGDAHEIHDPPIVRGADDHGVPALRCDSCHQDRNLDHARVPGAPKWGLAPVAMAWLDRTPAQICDQLKDRARNGDRTLAQIHEHIAHDELVGWGWSPGAHREPAPGSQAELGALIAAWIETGAVCPVETPAPQSKAEVTP